MSFPPYQLVTAPATWWACLAELRRQDRIALDLEANSMYAYREQVCLIQISIPGADYIVDPLPGIDLSGLGEILADPGVEKVLHAAEYDLILLKREYGWELNNLFDTMWAARILGYSRMGLATILGDLYQVSLNKKFQKADWCRRPLLPAQLAYAQADTHYLLALREYFAGELNKSGRMAEAQEIFAEQCRIKLNSNEFDADTFWSINGARKLGRPAQAILRALYIFRDEEARRYNKPYFKVLGDQTMLLLAQNAPTSLSALRGVRGMSEGQIQRYGRQLVEIIKRASSAPHPSRPKRPRPPAEIVLRRYEKLQEWRKQRAVTRGVESDVILPRDAMWSIAEANPGSVAELAALDTLGPWRLQSYGVEIVALLNHHPSRHQG